MATPQEEAAKRALALLKEQAELQQQINGSFDAYMEGLERYRKMQKTINANVKIQAKLQSDLDDMVNGIVSASQDDIDLQREKIKILQKQTKELNEQAKIHRDILADANKSKMALAKIGSAAIKGLAGSVDTIRNSFNKLTSLGLFEFDKAIKQSALSMGVLNEKTGGFRNTIKSASWQTSRIGIGLEDVAKIQGEYSSELGRAVELNEKSLVTISQIAKATTLGVEGASAMAVEMDKQAVSAEMTGKFINQTLDDTHKIGVNASKVIKNISSNIKMLNKYRFKDGVKGLAKMAATVTKLGVDMEFAASMSDKLWDVEGAVDMSAQLQVMGGAWANLADPFKLMYMARNDMDALTKSIADAAKQSMSLAKDGSIEMSAMEMQRLKIIAQQTGLEYDKLVESGKAAFKLAKIKTQVTGLSPELQEFIANTAEFKDGKAVIMFKGTPKLVSALSATDKDYLKRKMVEKKDMEERAKEAMSFDDAIKATLNGIKTYLMPMVEVINEKLLPRLDEFRKKFDAEKFGQRIEKIATVAGEFISGVGGVIFKVAEILGPEGALAAWAGLKLATWFANGVALAQGFNTSVNLGGGGGAGATGTGGMFGMSKGAGFKNNLSAGLGSKLLKLGGVATGLLTAYGDYQQNKEQGMSTKENLTRAGLKGAGAGLGAWGGAAAGAAIGSVVPVIGTLIGGLIGGALGAWGGGAIGEGAGNLTMGRPQNDAVFGGKPLSSDFSKGRAILQGGKISPIDNKDDILAMKPGGAVDKLMNSQRSEMVDSMKIEFGEIKINGNIKVDIPGTPGIALDIAKNNEFKREITRIVQSQLEINRNQKNSG